MAATSRVLVGVSVFTNAAKTRTRGVEITGNYASDFGDMGHVDWSVAINYNKTTVQSLAPLPAQVVAPAYGQTTLLGPLALSYITTASPRGKMVLGAYWTLDKFSVNLRENIYGKTSEIVSTDGTGNNGTKAKIPTTGITDSSRFRSTTGAGANPSACGSAAGATVPMNR